MTQKTTHCTHKSRQMIRFHQPRIREMPCDRSAFTVSSVTGTNNLQLFCFEIWILQKKTQQDRMFQFYLSTQFWLKLSSHQLCDFQNRKQWQVCGRETSQRHALNGKSFVPEDFGKRGFMKRVHEFTSLKKHHLKGTSGEMTAKKTEMEKHGYFQK